MVAHPFACATMTPAKTARHAAAFAFCLVLTSLASPAWAEDAGSCARSMVRYTFEHNKPPLRNRDPRTKLPAELTQQQRRELHTVLWPSEMSVRFTVKHWLMEKNFDCLEEAFADLEAMQPRFPSGLLKQVEFLGAAQEYVDAQRGMTEAEIAGLMKEWRAKHPNSILAEVMWSRMLIAAAWVVRGYDYAYTVSPENMAAFRRLNAAAVKQLYALSDTAPKHVLGHYVALRGLRDNGATHQQIQQFALEALRRFPHEALLAGLAADRLQPQWGGTAMQFETFAQAARQTAGRERGDRTYAYLYTRILSMSELHNYPGAQMSLIRAGLMSLANEGSLDEIFALQEFACMRRDADALRHAQTLWARYARDPQLRPPVDELTGECRAWERTLPPASQQADAEAVAQQAAPPAAKPTSSPLPQSGSHSGGIPVLFSVAPGPWERLTTPVGEVYSCTACEYPVQVLFAVGPALGTASPIATHDGFLASIATVPQQQRMALDLIEAQPGMDTLKGTGAISIERTGFGQLAGLRAFQYEATVKLRSVKFRESATVVVLKNRVLRIAINRADGPVGTKEAQALEALLAGVRLASD
jgi:hypothetical protein